MKKLLFIIASFGSLTAFGQTDTVKASYSDGQEAFYKFLSSNLIFPQWPKEQGISGKVYLSFIVSTTGELDSLQVQKPFGFGFDEEALRVIQLTNGKWKPATIAGKPISSKVSLPMNFKLVGEKPPSEKKLEKLREEYKSYLENKH